MKQKHPADIFADALDCPWDGLSLGEKGWKRLRTENFPCRGHTLPPGQRAEPIPSCHLMFSHFASQPVSLCPSLLTAVSFRAILIVSIMVRLKNSGLTPDWSA